MKRINSALRFDFFISTFMAILWFIYPFILIQLTADEIAKKSPEDKYIGRWLALMVIFSNVMSLRFIKNGKLLSKQSILLVKLICACIVLITTPRYYLYKTSLNNISILSLLRILSNIVYFIPFKRYLRENLNKTIINLKNAVLAMLIKNLKMIATNFRWWSGLKISHF